MYKALWRATDVYRSGGRGKLQGTAYRGALYDADGERIGDTLYFGDGDYVDLLGDEVTDSWVVDENPTYVRGPMITVPLFRQGEKIDGGLYKDFTPETIETREVTALAV